MTKWVPPILTFLICTFGSIATCNSHALQPGYLELRLIDKDLYAVTWKRPAINGQPMPITAMLPEQCAPRTPLQSAWNGSAYVSRWTAKCTNGLEGGTIEIDGLTKTATDVLIRFDFADGATEARRVTPARSSFKIATQQSQFEVIQTYFILGVEHILFGIDHLLFVLALLILVKGRRRIIATVTAFTLGHSLTLAGATLGFVHAPVPPLEAIIALSIVFVASEIIRNQQGEPGFINQYPWLVALLFGLLHGFGFAGALSEIGLPRNAISNALIFFNIGVEIGQLLFIAAVFLISALARFAMQNIGLAQPRWGIGIVAYAIGSISAFWVIARVAAFM